MVVNFRCTCGKKWRVQFKGTRCHFRCKKCNRLHSLPKRSPDEQNRVELNRERDVIKAQELVDNPSLSPVLNRMTKKVRIATGLTIGIFCAASVLVAILWINHSVTSAAINAQQGLDETQLFSDEWVNATAEFVITNDETTWPLDELSVQRLQDKPTRYGPGRFFLPQEFAPKVMNATNNTNIWSGRAESQDGTEIGTIQIFTTPAPIADAHQFPETFVELCQRRVSKELLVQEGLFHGFRTVQVIYSDTRDGYEEMRYRQTFVVELPGWKLAMTCASNRGWHTPLMHLMQTSLLTYQLNTRAPTAEELAQIGRHQPASAD